MGTNYFFRHDVCAHCGRYDEARHIGKSSAGWCFGLHVYPDEGIATLDDWKALWASVPHGVIADEYGNIFTVEEMLRCITERHRNPQDAPGPDWLVRNHASPGPHGLARHNVDGWHCVGHGEGTWDHMVGSFS